MKTLIIKPIYDIFSKKINSEKQQITLNKEKLKILMDYREKNSLVYSYLISHDFDIEVKELKIGDYIVKNIVIERKTISDFISSMINKRLLKQLEELKQYKSKLLIIEGIGEKEFYPENNKENKISINPNAIRGFLLSILLKHNIPIIFSKNSEDTGKFIEVLANKKEQEQEISMNAIKKNLTSKERLRFILEGFPNIGPKTSRKLLEKFGSLKDIFNSPIEELEKILGKRAKLIKELIEYHY